MKLTDIIMKKRFAPGKGVTELPPEKGVRRYFFLLSIHFSKLCGLNLLFVLFSIPIITMPAALCGMNRVLILLVREGNCYLWDDFIKEFKASFFKSLPFGPRVASPRLIPNPVALHFEQTRCGFIGRVWPVPVRGLWVQVQPV